MTRSQTYYSFSCPSCGWTAEVRWVEATRVDPGYLDGDPPEECPNCLTDMTEAESELSSGPEPDPDRLHDLHR